MTNLESLIIEISQFQKVIADAPPDIGDRWSSMQIVSLDRVMAAYCRLETAQRNIQD